MRFVLIILLFNVVVAFGQGESNDSCRAQVDTLTHLEVFRIVEKMPTVEGGMQALYKEISKKIKYPHIDKHPIESKVIIAFVVDANGKILGKRIIKNITGTDLGEQLLEIVDDLRWDPGRCNGQAVPTLQLIPMIIDFK
jgi:periplasmic protein TonB